MDEKGADANAPCSTRSVLLHGAVNMAFVNALLDRGADPSFSTEGILPLMLHVIYGKSDCVSTLCGFSRNPVSSPLSMPKWSRIYTELKKKEAISFAKV